MKITASFVEMVGLTMPGRYEFRIFMHRPDVDCSPPCIPTNNLKILVLFGRTGWIALRKPRGGSYMLWVGT
jgi:hypothetical protein